MTAARQGAKAKTTPKRRRAEAGPLVLVIGASRGIGLKTVRRALAAGYRVRAFSRAAERLPLDDANLEKVNGDARKGEDVARALDGVDVVIQALGVTTGPELLFGPIHLFSDATNVLLPAMEKAGVRRLICVTGFGAGDSRGKIGCLPGIGFNLFLRHAYDDKDIQERLIRESDLDWVIARPAILTNGPETGRYRVIADPDRWRNGLISRADVADFLVKQINDDRYLGQTPVLTC